jgi:hypothetical protein
MATAESDDGVGATDCPEHAGTFETGADDGLATGFDDARSHKQVLGAKGRIAHAVRVVFKIVGFYAECFEQFGAGGRNGAKSGHQLFDLSFVELSVLMDCDPSLLCLAIVGVQFLGYLGEVLAAW